MIFDVDAYPLPAIFSVSIVVILGSSEVGCWLGRRAGRLGRVAVSTLDGAIFGLLALMTGFIFAMSLSRREESKGSRLPVFPD